MTSLGGHRALIISDEGPLVASERDALDLIGESFGLADLIVIPVGRLAPTFFDLKSGLLGAVTQKFVNYQKRLAVVGDVSPWTTASKAFHDYVWEANQRKNPIFAADLADLETVLAGIK